MAEVPVIRLRRAPAHDPPYDDERHPDSWGIPVQTPLALPAPAVPPPAEPPDPARPGAYSAAPEATTPPARATAVRFLQTCLEIINGLRPSAHLRALASPLEANAVVSAITLATRRLRRTAGAAGAHDRLVRLRRMRIYQPTPAAIEIAAVLGCGDRAWAAAFRLERRQGGWQCTAAQIL